MVFSRILNSVLHTHPANRDLGVKPIISRCVQYLYTGMLLLSVLFFTYSPLYAQDFIQTKSTREGESTVDFIRRRIVVTAKGASIAAQKSLAEKKLWAMTEARKNCIILAAQAIGNMRIESKTFMEAGKLKGTSVSLQIQEYVRGIKGLEEQTETLKDGSVLATVSMSIEFDGNDGINKLLFATFFPRPDTEDTVSVKEKRQTREKAEITGFVFNVRGLKIQPSMMPEIYSETGELLYGPDPEYSGAYAVEHGLVGYTKDIKNVRERVGDNAVLIEVLDLKPGDNSSIVISKKESDRLQDLDRRFGIFAECRVAFLIK